MCENQQWLCTNPPEWARTCHDGNYLHMIIRSRSLDWPLWAQILAFNDLPMSWLQAHIAAIGPSCWNQRMLAESERWEIVVYKWFFCDRILSELFLHFFFLCFIFHLHHLFFISPGKGNVCVHGEAWTTKEEEKWKRRQRREFTQAKNDH